MNLNRVLILRSLFFSRSLSTFFSSTLAEIEIISSYPQLHSKILKVTLSILCLALKSSQCQSSNFDGVVNDDGFVLKDVPHLTDFLPDLPSYSIEEQPSICYRQIVVQKDSLRGVHFRRAGPREKVYFTPEEVRACIVTCGGLCPGINTVIREIVCGLSDMYDVYDILGVQGGYRGFYSENTLTLNPKVVDDIHTLGGTILCTSLGGHDTNKIVDSIQDRGINQVYIIGGDGAQR